VHRGRVAAPERKPHSNKVFNPSGFPPIKENVIRLTRLNGKEFFLNPELIESMEATPDTVVTLRGGIHHVIRESPEEVSARILAYRQQCLAPAAAGVGSLSEG